MRFLFVLSFLFSTLFAYEVRHVKTSDGLNIRVAVQKANKPSGKSAIIMIGHGSFIERHERDMEMLAARGFDAYCFDWRNHGRSDKVTAVPTLSHVNSYDDFLNDAKAVLGLIPQDHKVLVFGSSMGGHLALRFTHDHPDRVTATVMIAPMIDLYNKKYPYFVIKTLTWVMDKIGLGERFLVGFGPFNPKALDHHNKNQTSDEEEWHYLANICRNNIDCNRGGPSYSWVKNSVDSIRLTQASGYAQQVETPVYMAIARVEDYVCQRSQFEMCLHLPKCKAELFDGAHNLLHEKKSVRDQLWQRIDEFLGDTNLA